MYSLIDESRRQHSGSDFSTPYRQSLDTFTEVRGAHVTGFVNVGYRDGSVDSLEEEMATQFVVSVYLCMSWVHDVHCITIFSM